MRNLSHEFGCAGREHAVRRRGHMQLLLDDATVSHCGWSLVLQQHSLKTLTKNHDFFYQNLKTIDAVSFTLENEIQTLGRGFIFEVMNIYLDTNEYLLIVSVGSVFLVVALHLLLLKIRKNKILASNSPTLLVFVLKMQLKYGETLLSFLQFLTCCSTLVFDCLVFLGVTSAPPSIDTSLKLLAFLQKGAKFLRLSIDF